MNLLASLHPPAPLDLPRLALAQLPIPDDGTKWILIGGAMLLITYVVIRPMGKRRKDPLERGESSSSSASSSASGGLSQQRAVEREMSNLLVELSQMSRQITGQLDTRAAKLELLIKEADEKIARLEALESGAAAAGERRPIVMRSVSDAVAGGDAHERDVIGAAAAAAADMLDARGERIDPRHAQIYALADQGRGPREIARELGRPTGEIELILALRPQQPAR